MVAAAPRNQWRLWKWQIRQADFDANGQPWLVFRPYRHDEPAGRFASHLEAVEFIRQACEDSWKLQLTATQDWLRRQGHFDPAYTVS